MDSDAFAAHRPKAIVEASRQEAKARAAGHYGKADKYARRGRLIGGIGQGSGKTPAESIASIFGESTGPALGPAPGPAVARELDALEAIQKMDAAELQPGASGIWDMQWVASQLESAQEDALPVYAAGSTKARVLWELYEDAELEGIRWVELCTSIRIKGGKVDQEGLHEWKTLLKVWCGLEEKHEGRVR